MPVDFDYEIYEDSYRKEMKIWIRSLDISLKTNAKKTILTIDEWIQRMVMAGLNDSEVELIVKDAFLNGRGPFATFRNTFIRKTVGTVNLLERVPRDSERKTEELYTWVCMYINSCEDCMALHGETKTWSQWLDEGIPGSGHTQCDSNCNCDLVEKGIALSPDLKDAINLAEERRKQIVEEGGAVHV